MLIANCTAMQMRFELIIIVQGECLPEGACSYQLLIQVLRQGFIGLIVSPKGVECGSVVAPVLHELRGQLDCVPLDTPDARHQPLSLLSHHVL